MDMSGLIAYRKVDGAAGVTSRSIGIYGLGPDRAPEAPLAPARNASAQTAPPVPRPAPSRPAPLRRQAPPPLPPSTPVLPSLAEAISLYEQGRYTEASQLLSAMANAGQAASPGVTALLARTYANLGDLKAAVRWCEAAITADKLNPRLHYLHAIILQERNDPAAAAVALRRSTYLDPDFIMAHYALGHLARAQGREVEAARHLRNARSLLRKFEPEQLVPESDGITAARLTEIIAVHTSGEGALHDRSAAPRIGGSSRPLVRCAARPASFAPWRWPVSRSSRRMPAARSK